MIALDQPAGASTQPKMQQIPQNQQLTGQCPQCGWTPPVQNAFRPNNFNEYINEKGHIVVLSETDSVVEAKDGDGKVVQTFKRVRDNNGKLLIDPTTRKFLSIDEVHKQTEGRDQTSPLQTDHLTAVPAKLKVPDDVSQKVAATPIPNAATLVGTVKQPPVKTPEEIAATPKPTAASIAPTLPTPSLSQGLPEGLPPQPNKVV